MVFSLPTDACAQSFSIDWFTIQGGGGTSTGGAYSLSGTIGQAGAGAQPMTGGSFSLVRGFWSLFAEQSPRAPLLTIRLTATNTALVISGTNGQTGANYEVLSATNIALPFSNWASIATNQFDSSGNFRFTNRIIPGELQRYFRLRTP